MLLLLDLLDDDEPLLALGGGVEVSDPVATGDYPFFSAGFFYAGFFSAGFWGVLEQPYNRLSCHQQVFVRTLLERIYVTTTVEYIVAHAQHFDLSVRASVDAMKVLTKSSNLHVMPEVKREAWKENVRSARKDEVNPHIFALTRANDFNIASSQDHKMFITHPRSPQVFVNTGKMTYFVIESDKL